MHEKKEFIGIWL